jgi:hypothetical protein
VPAAWGYAQAGHICAGEGGAMSSEYYRVQLGCFVCVFLNDGSVDYPLKSFFANVPIEKVEEALHQHDLPAEYVTTL